MRHRTLAIVITVAVLAALLVLGVVRAGAQGTPNLPSIGAQQLLQNVAIKAHDTTAINGEFSWTNDLLGSGSLLSLGGGQPSTSLTSLLQGGSGRVWLQDGKARIESQSDNGNGDVVAVTDGHTAWTWQSATDTATQYTLPQPTGTASPAPSPTVDPSAAIAGAIERLAPTATLSVSGQQVVAGQDTYTLTLTPTSPVTVFGRIDVAVDGQRWVPLRVQVFAKDGTTPALSAGFTSVSYQPVSDSLFTFTPPQGATVVHKDLRKSTQSLQGAGPSGATPQAVKAGHKPLTLAQAKAQAPFLLTPSSTPKGIAFTGAYVTPTAMPKGAGQQQHPPVAVLHYGTGFGSVVVVETPATAVQDQTIGRQLGQLSLLGKTTVNGVPATKVETSLGSALTFRQGDVRVAVAGMVPWSDLAQIAGSLQ